MAFDRRLDEGQRSYLKQLHTLNSGQVTAVAHTQPPFSMECIFADPYCEPGGINTDIFRAVMNFLGLRVAFIRTQEGTTGYRAPNGSWIGLIGQLERGEADMSASLISIKPARLDSIDYSAPVSYYLNGFIIKKPHSNDLTASPAFLASPMRQSVWLCLCLGIVAMVLLITGVKWLMRPPEERGWGLGGEALLQVLRSPVRQSILDSPFVAIVALLVSWEAAMFFVISLYSAHLTSSFLISKSTQLPFEGLDQFAHGVYNREYRLVTEENPGKYPPFPLNATADLTDPEVRLQVAYRWNPPLFVHSAEEAMRRIKANGTLVYHSSYYRLLDLTSTHCDLKVTEDKYTMARWLAFAFPKGSKLQEIVSLALHNDAFSVDSFLQRLYKRYAKKRKCSDIEGASSQYNDLGLDQMQGSLWILLYGVAAGAFVFLLELVIRQCWKRLAKKRVNSTEKLTQRSASRSDNSLVYPPA